MREWQGAERKEEQKRPMEEGKGEDDEGRWERGNSNSNREYIKTY